MAKKKNIIAVITIISAVAALFISGLTYWDNTFRFKLDTSIGRQAKLYVISMDRGLKQPCVFMNIALINSGGKTEYIDDVKLNVQVLSNNNELFEQEFIPVREFTNIFRDDSEVSEILPIVVIGRTSINKKYIFAPLSKDFLLLIGKPFDLVITLYTKQRSKWREQNVYESKNITNVWHDFKSDSTYRSLIIELREQ